MNLKTIFIFRTTIVCLLSTTCGVGSLRVGDGGNSDVLALSPKNADVIRQLEASSTAKRTPHPPSELPLRRYSRKKNGLSNSDSYTLEALDVVGAVTPDVKPKSTDSGCTDSDKPSDALVAPSRPSPILDDTYWSPSPKFGPNNLVDARQRVQELKVDAAFAEMERLVVKLPDAEVKDPHE